MTKDFKNKNVTAYTPFNDAVSWILAGIALGLFIGLMFYLFVGHNPRSEQQYNAAVTENPQNGTTNSNANLSKAEQIEADKQAKLKAENDKKSAYLDKVIEDKVVNMEEDNRPRFNYHVILPILDVEVPVARPTEWTRKTTPKSKPKEAPASHTKKSTSANQYILQLSAHRTEAAALKAKKRMSQLGITTYVKSASLNGTTWYRVSIGPLEGQKIADTEALLLSKGVKPLKKPYK